MLEGRKLVRLEDVKDFSDIYWWTPEEQEAVMEMSRTAISAEDIVALTQVEGWVPAEEVMAELEEMLKQFDQRNP